MNNKQKLWTCILCAGTMLVMILDSKTALCGGQDGVRLCVYTVIPSLFPFFLISGIISSQIIGSNITFFRPIGRLVHIPSGSESIMLLGLLGGYPVGSKSIQQAYQAGSLSKTDAERMLGFCNNAGPAFIFGLFSGMFSEPHVPWFIWLIHLICAVIVGILLPGKPESRCSLKTERVFSLPQALEQSIKSTVLVCGWVILFRVVIAFLDRWLFGLFPDLFQIIIVGILELTNGCCELYRISNSGLRFIVGSGFLAFGGICVTMQVRSVTNGMDMSGYLPGKILHCLLSILLACIVQSIIFSESARWQIPLALWLVLPSIIGLHLIFINRKNIVAIRRKIVYNTVKSR